MKLIFVLDPVLSIVDFHGLSKTIAIPRYVYFRSRIGIYQVYNLSRK